MCTRPTYSEEEIILAGLKIEESGEIVCAFNIRQAIGGGNTARIDRIWNGHKDKDQLASETNGYKPNGVELPAEIQK